MKLSLSDYSRKMTELCERFVGTRMYFNSLSTEEDKFIYVMVKQYNYHSRFVGLQQAMERALSNAEAHKANGYKLYIEDNDSIMVNA